MDAGVVAAARNVAAFASLKAASTFDADVDSVLREYAAVRWFDMSKPRCFCSLNIDSNSRRKGRAI